MRLYSPQDGTSPRLLSEQGVEVWTPALVGAGMFVSNLGRVATQAKPRRLQHNTVTGYVTVFVRGSGHAYVHWLVLCSFEGQQRGRVRRLNKDKADNRLCNLAWSATRILSLAQREEIKTRLAAGEPTGLIARSLGVSSAHVAYYRNKQKVTDSSPTGDTP
jgi:DNA-binding CsgD family transcriptional regulator